VGTVFVVTRAEERHNPDAERFALKVPEYNATAARTMSEAEFLKLFREEAGALLSIPEHPNIANFVTFDAGAKPKPILVMELVEGVNCERTIASQNMTLDRLSAIIDGIMAGLEAMHEADIAHLDVKPSNVILRNNGQPVLVDFGLAGRKLRPGCATLCYGAPEIWAQPDAALDGPAMAADVYALGCLVFELLTTVTLFDGPTDVAVMAAHLRHDGLPPPLDAMAKIGPLQPLVELLYRCLRHDPCERDTVTALRTSFGQVTAGLQNASWPIRWC
jgi:serine/threonine protein kinase